MADLTITDANAQIMGNNVRTAVVQYGESITRSQPLYQNTDGKYLKADNNFDAATAAATVIALTPGATNEYGVVLISGPMDVGATLLIGETYVVSSTAGGIAPIGDLASGNFPTILGTATATDTLPIDIRASGVARP